jgi:hypothetical protein
MTVGFIHEPAEDARRQFVSDRHWRLGWGGGGLEVWKFGGLEVWKFRAVS